MEFRPAQKKAILYTLAAAGLAVLAYGVGGQIYQKASAPRPSAGALPADPSVSPAADPLMQPEREANLDGVIQAQRKRIMGRLRSLESVRRVATTVRPHIDRAIEQPAVQEELRILAAAAGMSISQYKEYFTGKQEADLLLESGGDPNARSVADAIGVAQFMVGTGQRCGLRVDLGASNALSRQIAQIERQIEWLEGQSPAWSRSVPPALRGVVPTLRSASAGADPSQVPAPGASGGDAWTRDQWTAYRRSQWENLVAKRRKVDHRFDPARSIMAQTKYLIRLTRRYGGVDWALQAYHGGEAGAQRTMRLFASGSGSRTLLASRGAGPGRWLPYAELYRHVSPTATPAAFGYLFGRSDDHRYYWWKVLMAERALNLYRKDAEEFERQWRDLQPGLSADAVWYPDPAPLQFDDGEALRKAYGEGFLVTLPAGSAASLGIRTESLASLAPENVGLHKGLRPEAMGALLRIAHLYRSFGGSSPVVALAMVQSGAYRARWDARYPDPPLKPGVPSDPEFHTTGVTFDLKRPARDWDRKVLEFALGRLYDNLRISWRPETDGGSRRYHVVVNPAYRSELVGYYEKAAR
jgi:hypothetical protein